MIVIDDPKGDAFYINARLVETISRGPNSVLIFSMVSGAEHQATGSINDAVKALEQPDTNFKFFPVPA